MHPDLLRWNLVFAWSWILLGFLSGLVLGLFFHNEHWLGGYNSWKRRLYRLGHVSFFGLGTANLLFFVTAHTLASKALAFQVASLSFLIGGITMPVCCVIAAHWKAGRQLFAVPVISLVVAGFATLFAVL